MRTRLASERGGGVGASLNPARLKARRISASSRSGRNVRQTTGPRDSTPKTPPSTGTTCADSGSPGGATTNTYGSVMAFTVMGSLETGFTDTLLSAGWGTARSNREEIAPRSRYDQYLPSPTIR